MTAAPKASRRKRARLTEEVLADCRVFRLDDAAWAGFTAILDRPAQRIDELAKLLNEHAPWDEGTEKPRQ